MARAAMSIPSISAWGSRVRRYRSLKVRGSPSSAFTTRYLGAVEPLGMNPHFMPAGNPAPPSPRRFDFFPSSVMGAGSIALAFSPAAWPQRPRRSAPPRGEPRRARRLAEGYAPPPPRDHAAEHQRRDERRNPHGYPP